MDKTANAVFSVMDAASLRRAAVVPPLRGGAARVGPPPDPRRADTAAPQMRGGARRARNRARYNGKTAISFLLLISRSRLPVPFLL
jgi:hypothetical protein